MQSTTTKNEVMNFIKNQKPRKEFFSSQNDIETILVTLWASQVVTFVTRYGLAKTIYHMTMTVIIRKGVPVTHS